MQSAGDQLRRKLLRKTKGQIKEAFEEKDVHLIKAVNFLDDLDSIINLIAEHCREWHSTHFPELNSLVKDNEKFFKLVFELKKRSNFSEKKLSEFLEDKEMAKKIAGSAKKSMGSDVDEKTLEEIKLVALNGFNLCEERTYLKKFIESLMQELAPNFSKLCGGILGAKMIAKIGCLKKLALVPASTVQLIGAEKALFLHLKKGTKGPKYGLIFQHPKVKSAAPWNKGRIARSLAGKLSIAARADYFGKNDIADELIKEIDERIAEIQKQGSKAKKEKHGKARQTKFKKTKYGKTQ